jgi:uncharacterized protein YxjI
MPFLFLLAALLLSPQRAPAQDLLDPASFLRSARTLRVPGFQAGSIDLARAETAAVLPDDFTMVERFFALRNRFKLWKDGRKLGEVVETWGSYLMSGVFDSWPKTFTLYGPGGEVLARADAKILALSATMDVDDPSGARIGTIKESLSRKIADALLFGGKLHGVYTRYHVLDPFGDIVAESAKVQILSTEFSLYDGHGREAASVRRSLLRNFYRLTDRWDVIVRDHSVVDTRLAVMIAAYKSSMDNERRKQGK